MTCCIFEHIYSLFVGKYRREHRDGSCAHGCRKQDVAIRALYPDLRIHKWPCIYTASLHWGRMGLSLLSVASLMGNHNGKSIQHSKPASLTVQFASLAICLIKQPILSASLGGLFMYCTYSVQHAHCPLWLKKTNPFTPLPANSKNGGVFFHIFFGLVDKG